MGRVRHVDLHGVDFELDGDLRRGECLAWKMELQGWNASVMGQLLVQRVDGGGRREPCRVRATISEMGPGDRARLRDWLKERGEGGTTRRYDSDVSSVGSDYGGRRLGRSELSSHDHVLRRMDERRARARSRIEASRSTSDPGAFGLDKETALGRARREDLRRSLRDSLASARSDVSQSGRRGRTAMNQALRAGRSPRDASEIRGMPAERLVEQSSVPSSVSDPMGTLRRARSARGDETRKRLEALRSDLAEARTGRRRRRQAEEPPVQDSNRVEGASSVVEAPWRAGRAKSGRGALRGALRDGLANNWRDGEDGACIVRGEDPRFTLRPGDRSHLEVDFSTVDALGARHRQDLANSGLFVPELRLGEPRDRVSLLLRFPSGTELACEAEVVAPAPSGTGLMLQLDAGQRQRIAAELAS